MSASSAIEILTSTYSCLPLLVPYQRGSITIPFSPRDLPGYPGPTSSFSYSISQIARSFFDFKFLGKPLQCAEPVACAEFEGEFAWDEWMTPDEQVLPGPGLFSSERMRLTPALQNDYKFVIDVDGNGWSGRFHR